MRTAGEPAQRDERDRSVPLDPPFGTFAPGPVERRLIALGRSLADTRRGRRIASLIRSTLSRIRRQPIDLAVVGQRMRLHASGNACEKRLIATPQFFDPVELELISTRARARLDFRFVDIGANVGAYTVFAALAGGRGARVLAVEPNRRVLDRLRVNVAANGLANVDIAEVALGDADGEAEFAVDRHNMGQSSLLVGQRGAGTCEVVRVRVRRLADLLAETGFTRIDVLKIDVEGYEDRVLVPFLETAPDAVLPAVIIMEDSAADWQADLAGALRRKGYVAGDVQADNRILVRG